MPTVEDLAAAMVGAERIVVLTGAGMGLASGIPTFRGADPGAVWATDVMEMGTYAYFRANPAGSWRWYRSRFAKVEGARPNAGHAALVALEAWQTARARDFLLVTQNVDTLHGQAGSRNLVEVHGRADRVRCVRPRCVNAAPRGSIPVAQVDFTAFDRDPTPENLPVCPECGALVRAHILWFDEYYFEHDDYGFETVVAALDRADLILCVGTSFSVGVTETALASPAPTWTIDVAGAELPEEVRLVEGQQEVVLPELVRLVGA